MTCPGRDSAAGEGRPTHRTRGKDCREGGMRPTPGPKGQLREGLHSAFPSTPLSKRLFTLDSKCAAARLRWHGRCAPGRESSTHTPASRRLPLAREKKMWQPHTPSYHVHPQVTCVTPSHISPVRGRHMPALTCKEGKKTALPGLAG